ncbi:sugar phosphate nucleotidyltransferase, partial [Bacillus cereus]
ALQAEQLGTAHAVDQAADVLANEEGTTLVICGDTPLITAETMEALLKYHEEAGAKATVLTAYIEEPAGYGRIVRNENGHVEKIVEHKDANEVELSIKEINTGTYCFDNKALFASLSKVSNDNVQGE